MLSKDTNSLYDSQLLITYRIDLIAWFEECLYTKRKIHNVYLISLLMAIF